MPALTSLKTLLLIAMFIVSVVALGGCRSTVPIHVWRPSKVTAPKNSRVALAPVSGAAEIVAIMDVALLAQRPTARADVALLSQQDLIDAAPVRMASTASLSNELVALQAAKRAGADLVLCGQVMDWNIKLDQDAVVDEHPQVEQNMNQLFFQRLGTQSNNSDTNYFLQTAWTVWDTHSGQIVGTEQVRLRSQDVAERFPDLQVMSGQPAQQLITASAREAWRMLAPVVEKDHVRLAKPFFQPGSWRIRRGVRAAKQGQWQIAEMHWQRAADGWLPSPAAHHNLAIAKAAREDFSGAKHELQSATGILSRRLPPETLVWLDHNHQLYCESLQLDEPTSGWAFHSPHADPTVAHSVQTLDSSQLPWWSDLPGAGWFDDHSQGNQTKVAQ